MGYIRRAPKARTGVVALAMLVTVAFTATSATPAGAITDNQRELLALTNEDRNDEGRSDLKLNKQLSKYAMKHSRQMANRGALFHTTDLAGVLRGIRWSRAGENVGRTGTGGTLEDLQNSFMRSSSHRKNVLDRRFDHAAVGVVEDHGELWVTVIFYG